MQTLATLLGIDADTDAGQLMAALLFGRIVMGDAHGVDTGRADPSGGDAEDGNEEEVDMEIDEV